MKSAAKAIAIAVASCCWADNVTAEGLEFTAKIHKEGQKDKKQYCYTDFAIDQSGNWTATTTFSNGKQIDGDHFEAVMMIKNLTGQTVITVRHRAGVNGSGGGKARERTVSDKGRVDQAVVGTISQDADYYCGGYNTVPDERIAGILLELVLGD